MTDIDLEALTGGTQIKTQDPLLSVDMPNEKLPVGQHRFGLTVVDDSGNESTRAEVTLIVVDSNAPTAVLDLLDSNGRTISNGRVDFGAGFQLSGKRSVDQEGAIIQYSWEVIPN